MEFKDKIMNIFLLTKKNDLIISLELKPFDIIKKG